MADDIRIKDLPLAEDGIQTDDYLPVDGATDGTRKITMQNIVEANVSGLETEATNTKGAINELFNKASRTVSLTQAEYDALPSSKLSDDIAYYITDGEPDVDNTLWAKVGRATLDTQAQNCSEAINEIKQSLSDKVEYINITDSKEIPTGYSSIQKTFTIPNGYNVINAVCSFGDGANSVLQAVSYFTNSAIWVNVLNQRAAAITMSYTITLFIAQS